MATKGNGLRPPPQKGGGLWPHPLCGNLCGYVAMWPCGYVAMWLCGYVATYVATWRNGYVVMRAESSFLTQLNSN